MCAVIWHANISWCWPKPFQLESQCKERKNASYKTDLSPSVDPSTPIKPSTPTLTPAGPPRPPLSIFRAASAALCLAAFLLGPWPVQLISPTETRNVKLGWWACPSAFSRSYTGVLPIRVPYSCSRLMGVFPGFTASICSILKREKPSTVQLAPIY